MNDKTIAALADSYIPGSQSSVFLWVRKFDVKDRPSIERDLLTALAELAPEADVLKHLKALGRPSSVHGVKTPYWRGYQALAELGRRPTWEECTTEWVRAGQTLEDSKRSTSQYMQDLVSLFVSDDKVRSYLTSTADAAIEQKVKRNIQGMAKVFEKGRKASHA